MNTKKQNAISLMFKLAATAAVGTAVYLAGPVAVSAALCVGAASYLLFTSEMDKGTQPESWFETMLAKQWLALSPRKKSIGRLAVKSVAVTSATAAAMLGVIVLGSGSPERAVVQAQEDAFAKFALSRKDSSATVKFTQKSLTDWVSKEHAAKVDISVEKPTDYAYSLTYTKTIDNGQPEEHDVVPYKVAKDGTFWPADKGFKPTY